MRTLSATLTAAGKSASRSPYVRARAIRKIGAVGRLDWERIYTGTEAEQLAPIAQAGDGSIIRVKDISNATGIKFQRITNPSSLSAWSTWPAGDGNATLGALGARGALACFAAPSTTKIWFKISTDYGATWTGWDNAITLTTPYPSVCAVAVKPNGDIAIFFNQGTGLFCVTKPYGGSWSARSTGPTFGTITGIAACYLADWNLIVTGTDATTGNPTVWTVIYGDGYAYGVGTWGDPYPIQTASAGSGVTFAYPALAMPDVFRLSYLETFAGTTGYTRPYLTHSLPSSDFLNSYWREPVPFNLEPATYGLALAYATGDYVYAATLAGVWRAPLVTGTGLDLSSAVTAIKTSVGSPTEGRATVHLNNLSSTYASPGVGALLELQRGSQITIDPGYNTTSGAEASALAPSYWIESLAYTHSKGKAELVIEAVDAWGLLDRWRARNQQTWAAAADNIAGILAWVLARVGLECALAGSNSSALSNQYPAFTIHPGESARTAVLRLLALIPDRIVFKGTTAYLVQPVSSTASGYAYGATHAILEAQYSLGNMGANHAQVRDASRLSESFSWADIALVYNRTAQVRDIALTSTAEDLARADAELRAATIAARTDVITVPAHAGQELLDVIDITDATAGLAAAKRRVVKMELEYTPAKGVYQHTLTLGDP